MEKIWKEVEKVSFSTCDELLIELKKNNFKVSPWIEDIVKKNNYKFNNNKFPVKLVRKYVEELGFEVEYNKEALSRSRVVVGDDISITD